jgi:hypothetical protein
MNKNKFVIKSTLVKRGWTESLIAKFLPEPDSLQPNPHYKAGPPMRLYDLKRVEKIEKSKRFVTAKQKAEPRKAAAKKGVESKLARTMHYVNSVVIKVPLMDRDKLIDLACRSYNEWQEQKDMWSEDIRDWEPANFLSSAPFLERICVNHLRHELTGYEKHLEKTFGKVGTSDAYKKIKEKVEEAIARAYPWLSEECQRQQKRREDQEDEMIQMTTMGY